MKDYSPEELAEMIEKMEKERQAMLEKMTPEEREAAELRAKKLIEEDSARMKKLVADASALAGGSVPEKTDSPRSCPNCGAPAEGGKFCTFCGSPLADAGRSE